MSRTKFSIPLALKGMAMGVAEAIPGVSGGTIAFITGIYEKLIHTIKSFDHTFAGSLLKGKFGQAAELVDFRFILNLLAGMAIGLVAAVFTITALLENYPSVLWGFFFGLIASSVVWILVGISGLTWKNWAWMAVGVVFAFLIVTSTPAGGSQHWWYVLICGSLAICALILPGISGSFILLLLGMYAFIMETLKTAIKTLDTTSLVTIGIFAAGCLIGLVLFARLLDWTFRHYRKDLLVLLCGFMIGSLWRIWPWRNVTRYLTEDGETSRQLPDAITSEWLHSIDVLQEENVFPAEYIMGNPYVLATIIAILAGAIVIWLFPRPTVAD